MGERATQAEGKGQASIFVLGDGAMSLETISWLHMYCFHGGMANYKL